MDLFICVFIFYLTLAIFSISDGIVHAHLWLPSHGALLPLPCVSMGCCGHEFLSLWPQLCQSRLFPGIFQNSSQNLLQTTTASFIDYLFYSQRASLSPTLLSNISNRGVFSPKLNQIPPILLPIPLFGLGEIQNLYHFLFAYFMPIFLLLLPWCPLLMPGTVLAQGCCIHVYLKYPSSKNLFLPLFKFLPKYNLNKFPEQYSFLMFFLCVNWFSISLKYLLLDCR